MHLFLLSHLSQGSAKGQPPHRPCPLHSAGVPRPLHSAGQGRASTRPTPGPRTAGLPRHGAAGTTTRVPDPRFPSRSAVPRKVRGPDRKRPSPTSFPALALLRTRALCPSLSFPRAGPAAGRSFHMGPAAGRRDRRQPACQPPELRGERAPGPREPLCCRRDAAGVRPGRGAATCWGARNSAVYKFTRYLLARIAESPKKKL